MAKMNINATRSCLCWYDKGAEGIVIASNPSAQRVTVEKVNMDSSGNAPDPGNPAGGIATVEAPIRSNVMLIRPPARGGNSRQQHQT